MKVIFDIGHGQEHWAQTGFLPRRIDTSLIEVANQLHKLGFFCHNQDGRLDAWTLQDTKGLVIPPPTGFFNPLKSEWDWEEKARFSGKEIGHILSFLRSGGRLLAFAYRFGDSFTKTNLGQLFAPLGCVLNDDAVIKLELVEKIHPLNTTFETDCNYLPQRWARRGVQSVHWRPVATFSILPDSEAAPVALSPDSCIRLRWPGRRILYQSAPICVCGTYGQGRYVLVGGPHAFEFSSFGLINIGDNSSFVGNILQWLLVDNDQAESVGTVPPSELIAEEPSVECDLDEARDLWNKVCSSEERRDKETSLVRFTQHMLSDTAILRPLAESVWSIDRNAEIDLVLECLSNKPLWAGCRGIVPVECKNLKEPVDASQVSWFASKVHRTMSRIGLFAARSFTKKAWSTAKDARLKNEIIIGFLSDEDFVNYVEGTAAAVNIVEASIVRSMVL